MTSRPRFRQNSPGSPGGGIDPAAIDPLIAVKSAAQKSSPGSGGGGAPSGGVNSVVLDW